MLVGCKMNSSASRMRDRRISRRERLAVRAKVVLSGDPANCVIRDRSDGGARLVFAQPPQLPAQFVLIEEVNGVRRNVKLIWAADVEAGVAFI